MSKCRVYLLAQIIVAICSINTVNLTKIANVLGGKSSSNSNYRKLQRFFSSAKIGYDELARYIVRLFFNEDASWYLTMDRTNWEYRKIDINILMLGICYKGRAIPICWKMLNKKGNSDTAERIELLTRFISLFGQHRIKALLADREFIGAEWFKWLRVNGIEFNIRLKKDAIATTSRGLSLEVDGLFYHLKPGQSESLKGKRKLWGEYVYLSGLRLSDSELLVVATSVDWENAIEIYGKRWEIETLFECLKGRGFQFEQTRLTDSEKVSRMVAVLALAYCWSHKTGEWQSEQGKGLKVKKHGRLEKSYFRHGLDLLQRLCIGAETCLKTLNRCIKLMIPRDISPPNKALFIC